MHLSRAVKEELWYPEEELERDSLAASSRMVVLLSRISKIRPFPATAQRIMAIIQNPLFEVSEVTDVIEEDPSLTANVLRASNSALLGGLVPSKDVHSAVVRLGRMALRELIFSATVSGLFEDTSELEIRTRDHCAATAAIARYLGKSFGLNDVEDVFVCGLMHDLGKMMLAQTEYVHYVDIMASVDHNKAEAAHEIERDRIGFDHAVLGGHMLLAWQIPDPVPRVVAWHHQPERAEKLPSVGTLISLVRLADSLEPLVANEEDVSEESRERIRHQGECERLDIDVDKLFADWEGLTEVRGQALELFSA